VQGTITKYPRTPSPAHKAYNFPYWYYEPYLTKENNTLKIGKGGHNHPGSKKPREGPRTLKFAHYTSLNTKRVWILEEALNIELILVPRKIPSSPNAD